VVLHCIVGRAYWAGEQPGLMRQVFERLNDRINRAWFCTAWWEGELRGLMRQIFERPIDDEMKGNLLIVSHSSLSPQT
jgi:hypothetical protein